MEKRKAWGSLPGASTEEKFLGLGIGKRRELDIRTLDEIARNYGVAAYLFFEEDLARNKTLESVQKEYSTLPEYERPYISVASFLRFTRENDPSFEQTLREFPLIVEVVSLGEIPPSPGGKTIPYVTALMPFLDELDVDSEPPHVRI